jgi:peptidoglycan hydrolase-like protein with peptidoglycan-binding domain
LRSHDWVRFARGYNGPNYEINNYDVRLAATYKMMNAGGAPDLMVRSAQAYLTFIGRDPHGIDGVMGRMTRAAMNDFQTDNGLPLTEAIDAPTLAALREAAGVG